MHRNPSLYRFLLLHSPNTRHFHSTPLLPNATQTLQDSIKTAIRNQNFSDIARLISSSKLPKPTPHKIPENPFSFLSSFPHSLQTQAIDQILQSFIPLRPRSLPFPALSLLLSFTLQNSPSSLPLSLAVLQSTIRSGCPPPPQTRLSLSAAWLDRRHGRAGKSVPEILKEMRAIWYPPDGATCNYVLSSLCAVDELGEATAVLRGLSSGGCRPDSEGYGTVIGACCAARLTEAAAELMREMVAKQRLTPRQGTVVRVVAAMRANGEVRQAAEMVELLEREGCTVGFQSHEMAVEGCVERKEFVAAGKAVMEMVGRGYIPYIQVRQKLVEGLAAMGERELASAVRRRLAELRS